MKKKTVWINTQREKRVDHSHGETIAEFEMPIYLNHCRHFKNLNFMAYLLFGVFHVAPLLKGDYGHIHGLVGFKNEKMWC